MRARQGGGAKVNETLLVVLSQYYDKKSQLIAGVFKYPSIKLKTCSLIHLPPAYISRQDLWIVFGKFIQWHRIKILVVYNYIGFVARI